jgi:hypothetical protein
MHEFMLIWCLAAGLSGGLEAQTLSATPSGDSAPSTEVTTSSTATTQGYPSSVYVEPSQSFMVHNYLWEAFGPYPVGGSLVVGAWGQVTDSVPEWHQGVAGLARRFGSDLGTEAVRTTTRYGLAELMHENTLYYRCRCTGFLPRTAHAVVSTLTARRGSDGHVVFSIPSLVAPYAGTMVSVYGWYPDRYNAKDAFRMGNYSLVALMAGNLGLEFLPPGPSSFLKRFHFYNAHGAAESGMDH